MKRILLSAMVILGSALAYGQWTPIPVENTTTPVVTMSSLEGYVSVGFDGDGIFQTSDGGNTWVDVTGDLPNSHINFLLGGSDNEVLIVGTDGGAFFGFDGTYTNCTGTGLTSTEVTYFNKVDEVDDIWLVGTKNDGVFTTTDDNFAWSPANNGISGNALQINGLSGYSDAINTWALNTNNGVYFSQDNFASWTSGNNGLTGDELVVTGSLVLNTTTIITTHGGAFMSSDLGQSWSPLIAGEKFNALIMAIDYNSGQLALFILGENSYVTSDLATWTQIVTPGEIIAGAATETELFIATAPSKNSETTGGLYRQPISSVVTAISNPAESAAIVSLQQNNPNPFSQSTTINYSVDESDLVILKIYDIMGREISTLVNEFTQAGNHQVTLENSELPAGLYYAVLKTKNYSSQIKMIKE